MNAARAPVADAGGIVPIETGCSIRNATRIPARGRFYLRLLVGRGDLGGRMPRALAVGQRLLGRSRSQHRLPRDHRRLARRAVGARTWTASRSRRCRPRPNAHDPAAMARWRAEWQASQHRPRCNRRTTTSTGRTARARASARAGTGSSAPGSGCVSLAAFVGGIAFVRRTRTNLRRSAELTAGADAGSEFGDVG